MGGFKISTERLQLSGRYLMENSMFRQQSRWAADVTERVGLAPIATSVGPGSASR